LSLYILIYLGENNGGYEKKRRNGQNNQRQLPTRNQTNQNTNQKCRRELQSTAKLITYSVFYPVHIAILNIKKFKKKLRLKLRFYLLELPLL
jgi:hypothetical protein